MVQKLGTASCKRMESISASIEAQRGKVELGITQCRTGVLKPRKGLVLVHGPIGAGHTARDIYSHSLLLALPPRLLLLSPA